MAYSFGFGVGPLGVNLSRIDTAAQHVVGSVTWSNTGKRYRYIKAGGTVGVGNFVKSVHADDPYTDVVIATASAAATYPFAIAPLALADNDFAWVLEQGVFEDDAQLVSANVIAGQPFVVDANGDADIAAATDITNARGIVLVDDADNTGTLLLF